MRVVNAEFKNIQSGVWETLNTNCPSGAAVVAHDVEFPSIGGVRNRNGSTGYHLSTAGMADRLTPVQPLPQMEAVAVEQSPNFGSLGVRYLGESSGPIGPTERSAPIQYVAHKDDIKVLTNTPTTFSGAEVKPSSVAFLEVEATSPGTTYEVIINVGGQNQIGGVYTLLDNNSEDYPRLSLDGIAMYLGEGTRDFMKVTLPAATWEPDPEFPDELLSTRQLPYQDSIIDFKQSSPKGPNSIDPALLKQDFFNQTTQRSGTRKLRDNEISGLGGGGAIGWPEWRPVITKNSLVKNAPHEFEYDYLRRDLNPAYNAEVTRRNVDYQEALARWQVRLATETSRTWLATHLAAALRSDARNRGFHNVSVQVIGSTIRVEPAFSVDRYEDNASGTHIRYSVHEVRSVSALPPRALDGDIIYVDKVPFRYTASSSTWREIPAVDISVSIPSGNAAWRSIYSLASNEEFVKLSDVFGTSEELSKVIGTHRWIYGASRGERFIAVSQRGVFVGPASGDFGFWAKSAVSTSDADGYYLNLGGSEDEIKAAISTDFGMVVVTVNSVYSIRLGSPSQVNVQKTSLTGAGTDTIRLASTNMGILMLRYTTRNTVSFSMLTPSPEGNRLNASPYLQQISQDIARNGPVYMTSKADGTEVFVSWADVGWRIRMGEYGILTTTSVFCGHWAGFVGDLLHAFKVSYTGISPGYGGVVWVKETPGKISDYDGSYPTPTITFHPAPQWRSYAPDGRYTLKQVASWGEVGKTRITWKGRSMVFDNSYPGAMPIHQIGEHRVTFSSADPSKQWWVKAFQYTIVARNGKTPGAWT